MPQIYSTICMVQVRVDESNEQPCLLIHQMQVPTVHYRASFPHMQCPLDGNQTGGNLTKWSFSWMLDLRLEMN